MINFECENVIIGLYRGGSGGKFLINNLGLSDDAFFQHIKLAIHQLKGNFDQEKKIKFIDKRLSEIEGNAWTDLELDDEHFFGVLSEEIDYFSEEEYISRMSQRTKILNKVISTGKYFFVLAHNYQTFLRQKKIWKNAKTIVLTDSFLFTKLRNCRASLRTFTWDQIVKSHEYYLPPFIPHLGDVPQRFLTKISDYSKEYVKDKLSDDNFIEECKEKYEKTKLKYIWEILRKDHWPVEEPSCIQDYINYPEDLKKEIQETFNKESKNLDPEHNYPQEILDSIDFKWNVSWYFSEDDTVRHIRDLYDKIGLGSYNEEMIRYYYSIWLDKINEMSKISRYY